MVVLASTAKKMAIALNDLCLKVTGEHVPEASIGEISDILLEFITELLITRMHDDIRQISKPYFSENKSISAEIDIWKQDPATFLNMIPPSPDIACGLFNAIRAKDKDSKELTIVTRRVYLVQFYLLRKQYAEYFSCGHIDPLANHLFLRGMCDERGKLQQSCSEFARRGKRLYLLTTIEENSHPGTLLPGTTLIPSDLERRMPVDMIEKHLGTYEFISQGQLDHYDRVATEVQALLKLNWMSWLNKLKEQAQQCIAAQSNEPLKHRDLRGINFPYLIQAPSSTSNLRHSSHCDHSPLSREARKLAQIMFFMGATVDRDTLLAYSNFISWGTDGEIDYPELPGIFRSPNEVEARILELYQKGYLARFKFQHRTEYVIDMKAETIQDPVIWKAEAVKLIAFAFPAGQYIDPLRFHEKARRMLPSLYHVSTYLRDPSVLQRVHYIRIFEACLEATKFSTIASKIYFVNLAEQLSIGFNDQDSWARIASRRLEMSQLYPTIIEPPPISMSNIASLYNRNTPRSNAFYGGVVLQMARDAIKRDQPTSDVIDILSQFRPLNNHCISSYESIINNEKCFLIGKSWRNQGCFEKARIEFDKVFIKPEYRTIDMLPHYYEVWCESGDANRAVRLLEEEMHAQPTRRIKIAYANSLLFVALQLQDRHQLQMAYEQFQEILASYRSHIHSQVHLVNIYRLLAAMALIEHVQGLHTAFESWERARDALGKCSTEREYSEMIIAYAQCEIAIRERRANRDDLEAAATRSWSQVGKRKYFSTGIGTIWPDVIGNLMEANGHQRIIPLEKSSPVRVSLSRELLTCREVL